MKGFVDVSPAALSKRAARVEDKVADMISRTQDMTGKAPKVLHLFAKDYDVLDAAGRLKGSGAVKLIRAGEAH